AVAAGSGGVDEVLALRPHRQHVIAHRLRAARDLVRRLSLQTQRDQEAADLCGCRLTAHDRAHHLARLLPREVAAVEQLLQRLLDHLRSRKFRAICPPWGVSTDSGWNWTPSTGSSRWRTAITSPSSARADTSSSSGTRVAASEWYRPASNGEGSPAKMPQPSCATGPALPWTSVRAGPTPPPNG